MYAYNTAYNYVKLANLSAALVRKFLDLPVTLITDSNSRSAVNEEMFDQIIEFESDETNVRSFRDTHDSGLTTTEWKNTTRASAHDLSPYDQTLLIDCDYFIFTPILNQVFETETEFSCFKTIYDESNQNMFANDTKISRYGIPHLWATVIYFTKSLTAHAIFHMMKVVQENYEYYSILHGFNPTPFRNDFALSIACHTLSGYGSVFDEDELYFRSKEINLSICALSSQIDIRICTPQGIITYMYEDAHDNIRYVSSVRHTDIHLMNKSSFEVGELYNSMMTYATS